MPGYRLTYFLGRGLAEPIRQLFVFSGTPFEDVRISIEDWNSGKKGELGLEWGVLPVLDIDGERKTQSWAILRLLARKFNLAGKDEAEEFRCDEICEAIRDYNLKTSPLWECIFQKPDPVKLEERKKHFAEVENPLYLSKFNNLLKKKGNVYLVGDSLTYADIAFANFVTQYETVFELKLVTDYPAVQKLITTVHSEPKIAEWIQNRPKTPF